MDEREVRERLAELEEQMVAIREMLENMPLPLERVIEMHEKWLAGEEGGVELDFSKLPLDVVQLGHALFDPDRIDSNARRGWLLLTLAMTNPNINAAHCNEIVRFGWQISTAVGKAGKGESDVKNGEPEIIEETGSK